MPLRFPRATAYVHELLTQHLEAGDLAIDATCGRGHDTLHLAHLVGPSGKVLAFDIQAEAIQATRERLQANEFTDRVALIHACHTQLRKHLVAPCRAVVFNLGYLPGGDKNLITTPTTTLPAIEQALDHLITGGLVTITVYPGHPGGETEAAEVETLVNSLPQSDYEAVHYRFVNQANHPPEVYAIRKC